MRKRLIILLFSILLVGIVTAQDTTYTASTKTTCQDNVCTKILYSGIKYVYEDDVWKNIEDSTKSLKEYYVVEYLEIDPDFDMDVIDFNNSGILIHTNFTGNPSDYPEECTVKSDIEAKCQFKISDKWEINDTKYEIKYDYKWEMKNAEIVANNYKFQYVGSPFNRKFKFGGNSTTIMLQDNETENLDDAYLSEWDSNKEFGGFSRLYLGDPIYTESWEDSEINLKFNIDTIPSSQQITDAKLYLYANSETIGDGETLYVSNYLIYSNFTVDGGEWIEGDCTSPVGCLAGNYELNWNERAGEGYLSELEDTVALTDGDSSKWKSWDSTTIVSTAYSLGYSNVSIKLNHTTNDGLDDGNYIEFWSKEYSGDTSLRPYLNITYLLPTLPTITINDNISDTIYTNDTISINITIIDAEHETFNVTAYWYRNSTNIFNKTEIGVSNNTKTEFLLGSANFSKNHNINVSFVAVDVYNTSNTVWSNTVTISNSIPIAYNVSIDPLPAESIDNLNCTYDYFDTDDDSEGGVNYRWYNDSMLYGITTQVLGSGNISTNEKWLCSVKVNDSEEFGLWYNSSEVTIGDDTTPILQNKSYPSTGTQNTATTLYIDCYDAGSSIEYVKVNITNPNSVKSTSTFTLSSGNTYSLSFTPSIVGTYNFNETICIDTSGNYIVNYTQNNMVVSSILSTGGGGGISGTRCNWKIIDPANHVWTALGHPLADKAKTRIMIHNNETQGITFNFRTEGLSGCEFNYNTLRIEGSTFGINHATCPYPTDEMSGKIIIEGGECDTSIAVAITSSGVGAFFLLVLGGLGLYSLGFYAILGVIILLVMAR